MSKNGEKYRSLFLKAHTDVLKCLLSSRRLKKPDNIHSWEAVIREFGHFFKKQRISYQNGCWLIFRQTTNWLIDWLLQLQMQYEVKLNNLNRCLYELDARIAHHRPFMRKEGWAMGTKSNLYNDIVNFVANSTGKLIIEKITLQESLNVPHLVNKYLTNHAKIQ